MLRAKHFLYGSFTFLALCAALIALLAMPGSRTSAQKTKQIEGTTVEGNTVKAKSGFKLVVSGNKIEVRRIDKSITLGEFICTCIGTKDPLNTTNECKITGSGASATCSRQGCSNCKLQ